MAYLGATIGGFVILGLLTFILSKSVFRWLTREVAVQVSVIVSYLVAASVYGYNETKWGVSGEQGILNGLGQYALAAVLVYVVFQYILRQKSEALTNIAGGE